MKDQTEGRMREVAKYIGLDAACESAGVDIPLKMLGYIREFRRRHPDSKIPEKRGDFYKALGLTEDQIKEVEEENARCNRGL